MRRLVVIAAVLACAGRGVGADAPAAPAAVETTLPTAGGQIRQFALDGDPDTHFTSAKNPTKADHLTVVFERTVVLKSVAVTTGLPNGGNELAAGALEVSTDGKRFVPLAKFDKGAARVDGGSRRALAVRIRPAADMTSPLTVREVVIDAVPKVAVFKYPVEVAVNADDAPDMREWAEKAARVCERHFGMICDEVMSDGFKPATQLSLTVRKDYKGIGVAEANGSRITASADFFRKNPNDVGAMIHETVHTVQLYRNGGEVPGWLVEGIADYVRYFKYEPGKLAKLRPEQAKYDGSYGVTAAFLAYVEQKHAKGAVGKVNAALREGRYTEAVWKDVTGKSLPELAQRWRASLAK